MRNWILDRLEERSTWYGLGYVIAGAVAYLAPAEWQWLVAGGIAAVGGAKIVTPEH